MLINDTGDAASLQLARHRGLVAEYMRKTAPAMRSRAGRMAAYHMGWMDREGHRREAPLGKLLRPCLCLWAAEAYGGDVTSALPAAAALEWVHNFTLIHDDIQDGDRERHGRATVWSIWGAAQGINAGDALCATAFHALCADGASPQSHLGAMRVLAEATLEVVEGQCLDLELERCVERSPRSYLRLVTAKTGALFGASLEIGALMAGAPPEVLRRLRRAGRLLGVAFQMRDDWLGTWGDPAITGKRADGDLVRRKMTYLIVSGYAAMDPEQRRRLRELFDSQSPEAAADIRALLEEVGGPALTSAAPQHLAERAAAIVAETGPRDDFADSFREVARYVAHRSR